MVEQGDILKVEGIKHQVVVISKNSINELGRVIVCPLIHPDVIPALSVMIDDGVYVACDTIKQLDLEERRYSVRGHISILKLISIIDRVQSMMDYY
jgi:mRNA-degrading endonuclease toxin of MazEF toxin-antitoxin module